ncbi:MAG: hypothetical protein LC808_04440 [Actinobacteria bacterium]|nr:hypothetical protein [Actinomycetota bacterium]
MTYRPHARRLSTDVLDDRCSRFNLRAAALTIVPLATAWDEQRASVSVSSGRRRSCIPGGASAVLTLLL